MRCMGRSSLDRVTSSMNKWLPTVAALSWLRILPFHLYRPAIVRAKGDSHVTSPRAHLQGIRRIWIGLSARLPRQGTYDHDVTHRRRWPFFGSTDIAESYAFIHTHSRQGPRSPPAGYDFHNGLLPCCLRCSSLHSATISFFCMGLFGVCTASGSALSRYLPKLPFIVRTRRTENAFSDEPELRQCCLLLTTAFFAQSFPFPSNVAA